MAGWKWGLNCDLKRKWIPKPSTFRISNPLVGCPADVKVSCLIDHRSVTWQANMVIQGFAPDDAKVVLSIPLSSRLPADRLTWAYTPKGNLPCIVLIELPCCLHQI